MNERSKKTVLLVEDEVLIAMAEKQELSVRGYSVEHLRTGEAAVAHALNADSRPDLILMDIDLGEGIDGTEAARQILNEIEIPVVFLSSHTEQEVVEKTEKITSYGYVVKNSGITLLDASIKMAFKLFEARMQERQHEAALLHSRDLMRYVIEHNRSAVAIHDKDLNYIYVSKQYLDQFHVKDRNIIGKHHYEVFPDLPQKFRDAHQRALRGESSTGEDEPYKRDDGTVAWTRWECRPWYEADNTIGGLIVYTEVLSEEPAKRINTRDTVNYLRSILRTTQDGFAVIDMNGNFLDVNDAYCEMCGYSRAELLQLSIPNIAVEEDPELTAERFQRIKSHGHALFHAQNWRKDGTPFDVEVSASFLGGEEDRIVVFFRDITERKLAEDRLRESEEKYSSLFDQAVDAIYIHDFEGKIIDVNQATCEQTGYSKNELLQLSVFDIHVTGKETINFSESDTKRVWQQSRVGERRSFEAEHRRKDGAVFPVRLSTGTVRFGNEVIVMAVIEDITERKQAEEEVQRQLAEKENILREVHHRIKNNMAQVEGLLLLQADSTDNPHAQSALQEAISRVRSIRVVYDKLLIGNDYQDLSVKDYVESLVASIVAVFAERRNISIETRLADFALSSQRLIPVGIIINELLTNTFKYAFTGRKDGKVVIQLDKNETHATLSIEDDGVGLDDGGTADTSTGFGLSIVQMLVEQLNGAYSVEINGGTKSVVEFEL